MEKTMILVMVLALIIGGCELRDSHTPGDLSKAKLPVIIQCINAEGVILVDAEGKIYTYTKSFYIASVLMASDLKAGDVLSPATQKPEKK